MSALGSTVCPKVWNELKVQVFVHSCYPEFMGIENLRFKVRVCEPPEHLDTTGGHR